MYKLQFYVLGKSCVMILFAVILSWFVSKQAMNDVLDGNLIDEAKVEFRPEKIPDSVLDDICLVRQHFSFDGLMLGYLWKQF